MAGKKMTKLPVVELFAGVGGFRVGLEAHGKWKVVFSNQWEPGKKNQWAFDCYVSHYKNKGIHSNQDIAQVSATDVPDCTLLVGGFPCQDYSVASTLAASKGIEGRKGVLWWEIRRIVEKKQPPFILLENVDRLLLSPAKQRGRDFGIILSCLNTLGYVVEWRVVNAADYGFAQRRRRTFIFARKLSQDVQELYDQNDKSSIIQKTSFFSQCFPIAKAEKLLTTKIPEDLVELTNTFHFDFQNAGFACNHIAFTQKVIPVYVTAGQTLGSILESDVDEHFYIKEEDLQKWHYMKGAKRETRKTRDGYEYHYAEGAIPFPDVIDRPSRTMLTSESSKNRSTHIVADPKTGRIRILTPIECERLNGFPDNWTNTGMPEKFRYFCMGNALVVGLIDIMGEKLRNIVQQQKL